MAQQNATTVQETLRPVQRQAQKGLKATKDFFADRSTMQWILMILVPIALISAIAGYFLYRNNSPAVKRRRTARKAAQAGRAGTFRGQRSRVGRRVGGRARSRRSRTTRTRGRGLTTPQTTP